jgi:hypothetical protein
MVEVFIHMGQKDPTMLLEELELIIIPLVIKLTAVKIVLGKTDQ